MIRSLAEPRRSLVLPTHASGSTEHRRLAKATARVPGDRVEAAKMYVVLADAIDGKLTLERSRRIQLVLDALENGHINVAKADIAGSRARYDHSQNLVEAPPLGFDVSRESDRAAIVHEAEHVAQDIQRRAQNRYASEAEAHEAAADYLLHRWGALVEAPSGTHVDLARATAAFGSFQALGYEAVDEIQAAALVRRLAYRAIARGELFGEPTPLSAKALIDAVCARQPFAEAYEQAQRGSGVRTLHFTDAIVKKGL